MKFQSRVLIIIFTAICLLPIGAAAQPVRSEMLVTTEWLSGQLKNPGIAVVQIGADRKGYDEGHIPGAAFVAFSEILATRNGLPNEIPPVADLQGLFTRLGIGEKRRIIVCWDANLLMATRLIFTLEYLGHGARTALLDGGLPKWKAEKRALETAAPAIASAPFTPRLRPEVAVQLEAVRDLSWVAANAEQPDVVLIDSRPSDQYRGSESARTGHIPGAAHLYWMDNVTNDRFQTMKPASELRKMYAQLGLTPGKRAVSYCNSGVQASQTWFTLRYLGIDASMYDASMSEWSKAPNTTIVSGDARK